MSDCSNECGSCGSDCENRTAPQSFLEETNEFSSVKKVIGVVSGKGGVGKSLVTSLLAVTMNRRKYSTAILDADITGPSIPKAFGLTEKAAGTEAGLLTVDTKTGIRTMSVNSLLEEDTDPVVWRGPIIAGTVKQFWTDVIWGDVDFMFIDMPPGTGDVPLTVFQSLPVDGIIIVTSPQELVSMIVGKAVKMAQLMNVPILGIVENMSYFVCPDCGKKYSIFGESHIEEVASQFNIKNVCRLPIHPELASKMDKGTIESFDGAWLDELADCIEGTLNIKLAVPYENGQIFQHFGHSEQFEIFEIKQGKVLNKEIIPSDCEGHGALAGFLAGKGVTTLICGGIGDGAIKGLAAAGIQVVAGVSGKIEEQVQFYLNGSLQSTDKATCDHHEHSEGHSCTGNGH
ncbi:P-loop NTPase [Aminipila luticellarii]|uniref:Iron-sulfur cluster carrier protein n=1 Tax=Aminipila luticellarii TaxID=2507160 RepID=A0A410PT37_9FIRM|nr:P-loop NTPase [Aminipila luticellarii]QAT42141.1 dinitrogenase iron-molybdenum cofactor biosynthesis protein [Aminipila luticellarii]